MNILKMILEDHGQICEPDLPRLAAEFPDMPVVIKWAKSMRSKHTAQEALKALEDGAEANGDYAREVFIPVQTLDFLNKVKEALK